MIGAPEVPPEQGQRLDAALAERGIARSRTHAAELIATGRVRIGGKAVIKASYRVPEGTEITVDRLDHYVSRAAHKLMAGLDAFDVDVAGRECLDIGASTGGFTQVLLERGAKEVVALDVGHTQISPLLRSDERVKVLEGVNARYLTPENLTGLLGAPFVATVVVADLSFISLTMVIPALTASAAAGADFIFLIKPQFEVGKTRIREGIVTNPGLRMDAVTKVLWAAFDNGLGTAGLISSPIIGALGNHEYVVWFSATRGTNPTEWLDTVTKLAGA